ncbi:MAG: hypothetical protein ACYDGN_14435 [Acidimicrobiales bacterium]
MCTLLFDQLTSHYEGHLRPRLAGMSDEEYFFEPVPGCWSIRPRSRATSPMAAGAAEMVADFARPAIDHQSATCLATADEAMHLLDETCTAW